MIVRRLAALTGASVLVSLALAAPAFAHGAPSSPISRQAACAGGGSKTGTDACQAALKANGGSFGTFDDVRVPNVNGNDKKFVPDGELCSGGLDAFKGLDLARADFPATSVTGGKTLSIKYTAPIAHQGSFRVYLTKQGYSPTKKLAWGDLDSKLADVADPPLSDGAFHFSVKLPQRTGRQILYIVWQTSNTPDSYYSCSDLVFPAASTPATTAPAKAAAAKSTSKKATATPSPSRTSQAAAPAAAAATEPPTSAVAAPDLTPVSDSTKVTLGHQIIFGAIVLAVGALIVAAIGRLRRKRFENR
jgi:predicted carbohydrate-binding protein with CBM5 and CBM33 domain